MTKALDLSILSRRRAARVMPFLFALALLLLFGLLASGGRMAAAAADQVAPASAIEAADVTISEIRIDQPDADNDEYFELAGAAGTSLDGLTYLVIGDGTGASGVIEAVIALTGTVIPADGYYLAAEGTYGLGGTPDLTTALNFENGDNVTHLLVRDFTGANGDDLDTDDDGALDVTPWAEILDLIALVEEENPPSGTEYHYGPPAIGPDGSFVPGHAFACGSSWQIGSFATGVDDTPGEVNLCPVTISEIRIDQDSTDNDEYVELAGAAGTSLDGLTYLVIGDGTGASGVIEAVVDLAGMVIPADNYFLAVESTYTLGGVPDLTTVLNFENSDNVTHLLVRGFTGANGDDLDTDDDGALDVTPWAEILDLIALVEEENPPSATEYHYGPPAIGPDGSYVPGHVYHCPRGWNIGSFSLGVDDTPGADNAFCPSGFLDITKEGPLYVSPGERFTYTITIDNELYLDLTDVVITDVLPANTTFASASDGGTLVGGTVVSWTIPAGITDGTIVSRTFQVTAALDSGVGIVNSDYGVSASNWVTVTTGDPVSTAVVSQVCGDPATAIHAIQGNGAASPMDGDLVALEGVVVGDYQDTSTGLSGFFVQEEDADADTDPTTSEGIFVYDDGFGVDVVPGDVVRVLGLVDEYYDLTDLTGIVSVTVCSAGSSVTPVTVTLPVSDVMEWEYVEGMLIEISQELFVTENYFLGRYGQVQLSVGDRLYNPTNVTTPGAAALALQAENDLRRFILDDGNAQQNPDPIIYPSPELSATHTLRSGDSVSELVGVVDYAYGDYRVQPTGLITFTTNNERPVTPDSVDEIPGLASTLRVASFNVLNYFNGDGAGGGFPTSRGADTLTEFVRQRDKIIAAIVEMDADVIGLMEIENDGYDSLSAIQDLVNGLNAVAPVSTTYAFIDPGVPAIGTDEIAVGLLYRTETVNPVGAAAILDSTFDPDFIDTLNRPVLAQTFEETATGEKFTVAVNHLKSKGSSCDSVGDPDGQDGQGNCNGTRTDAATVLAAWLATDPTGSGDADFMIIGDLNSYAMEDPIVALEDAGYTNLIKAFEGLDAYSYVFDGQAGYLDHALANDTLTLQVTGVTIWHINTDEPSVLDYNEEYKSVDQVTSLYDDGPYRASDHDPVVVGLNLSLQQIYLPLLMRN